MFRYLSRTATVEEANVNVINEWILIDEGNPERDPKVTYGICKNWIGIRLVEVSAESRGGDELTTRLQSHLLAERLEPILNRNDDCV